MNSPAEFNRVTFGLPVETFRVSAHIALEERLPIVTEFVLRLLRICGQISLANLREYFGFTDTEALSLMESLTKQGLIELDGDNVRLSGFASERFEEAGGEHPRFSKVELKQDTVTFDLHSFTPLRSERGSLLNDNIIKLDVDEENLGSSIEHAKTAYRYRYPEIASMRKDFREKSYGVYSIEDVESKRRGYVPIPVSFSLDSDRQVVRGIDSAFELIAPPNLLQFFNEQVTKLIPRKLSIEQPSLVEFVETFNIQVMRRFLVGGKFDLKGYLADVHVAKSVKFPKGTTPILGNLYLPQNRERIVSRLIARREGKRRHGKFLSSLAWLVPDYSLWGRGDAFSGTVASLVNQMRSKDLADDLYVFAATEHGTEASMTNRFRVQGLRELHLFRPQVGNEQIMGGRLELMMYPTAFVAVMFHMSLPGNSGLWLPIGFISTLPRHLDTAQKVLCRAMGAGRYAGRARFRPADSQGASQAFDEACSFLSYDSVSTKSQQDTPDSFDDEEEEEGA